MLLVVIIPLERHGSVSAQGCAIEVNGYSVAVTGPAAVVREVCHRATAKLRTGIATSVVVIASDLGHRQPVLLNSNRRINPAIHVGAGCDIQGIPAQLLHEHAP